MVDALYFGERHEDSTWCVVVFRDPAAKDNLWWRLAPTEATSVYGSGKEALLTEGYEILSVTGDGFSGTRQAFSGIPFQMCLVHMERLVVRGTTRKPELEAGRVLLALAKSLHTTDQCIFERRLRQYIEKYREFLNEKTIHPLSGEQSFTHENLRLALHSLLRLKQYLFTFEKNHDIPKTSNSLEGHFSHIREVIEIHRGLSKARKWKIINSILLASSIAPSKAKLKYIL